MDNEIFLPKLPTGFLILERECRLRVKLGIQVTRFPAFGDMNGIGDTNH